MHFMRHPLTSRQKQFLRALVQLWQARGAAVHYSAVAGRMGVSRFSAYDMLRALETQGLVEATYLLDHAGAAGGRSSVYYSPTAAGLAAAASAGGLPLAEEWRAFRDRLLGRLQASLSAEDTALLDDLLEQIPKRLSPLFYCSEVITALLINLNSARERISEFSALDAFKSLTMSAGEPGFALLAGLSLGAGARAAEDNARSRRLFDYTRRYQELLRDIGEDGKHVLSDFLQDAIDTIIGAGQEKRARKAGGSK